MTSIWRYVLAHDSGWAPCIDEGALSLCCCKPIIRANAQIGDWVVGFMPKRFGLGLVAWGGVVSEAMPMGVYSAHHLRRRDAVYQTVDHEASGREVLQHFGGDFHNSPRAIRRDISGRNALLFYPFWYFGGSPKQVPEPLVGLAHCYVGQTKRPVADDTVQHLSTWFAQWPSGVHGEPRKPAMREIQLSNWVEHLSST